MTTLKEYYKHIVEENEKGNCWAEYYYGIVSGIINEYNYKKIAEIGIGYGTHSKQILKNTNIDHIYLIDPMQFYPNDGFATDIMNTIPTVPGNNFNELTELIQEYLSEYQDRYTWYRKNSTDVTLNEIPNHSLDCVFIDGNHTYNYVIADLIFWRNKVRPGGQLLGDDYWMDDVARAVHDFEKLSNLKADFLTLPGKDYKIYRFKI